MDTDREAVEDGTLRLGDGRRLGYAQYGVPDGEPFFYFHGHPGSRLEGRFAHAAAAAAGLRVLALDRPGEGHLLIIDHMPDLAERSGKEAYRHHRG
jgi:hypothetical protein